MNPKQTERLSEAPILYQPVVKRAYSGNSRTAAIKAFCLQCVGYVRKDVTCCAAQGCPLWLYRPYQTEDEDEDA